MSLDPIDVLGPMKAPIFPKRQINKYHYSVLFNLSDGVICKVSIEHLVLLTDMYRGGQKFPGRDALGVTWGSSLRTFDHPCMHGETHGETHAAYVDNVT